MVTNNSKNEPTAASGKVLQGQGVGTASNFSTATYPSTATGTGKILRADGTNWVATTATYPDTAGTSGNVLTSDGTNWSSTALTNTLFLTTGTLTNAQIKALRATPITVIAAQGTGKIAVPIYIAMTMNYGGSNIFTAGADVYILLEYNGGFQIGSTGEAPMINAAIIASSSQFCYSRCVGISTRGLGTFTNVAVKLLNVGTTEIAGNAANDNTMSYELMYYVMTP